MDPGDIVARNLRHSLFTWSAQHGLEPQEIVSAGGAWFEDRSGRRILDLASFAINASAALFHPRIAGAIAEQARSLPAAAPSMATEIRARAGEARHRLIEVPVLSEEASVAMMQGLLAPCEGGAPAQRCWVSILHSAADVRNIARAMRAEPRTNFAAYVLDDSRPLLCRMKVAAANIERPGASWAK